MVTSRLRVVAVRVGSVALVAFAVLRCYAPTEMVLDIRSDLDCGAKPNTRVLVGSETVAETGLCEGAGGESSIGTLTFVPSGDREGRATVEVVLAANGTKVADCPLEPGNCISARRSFSYVAHTSRRLPIRLERACLGKSCPADQTCQNGKCTTAEIACQGPQCDVAPIIALGPSPGPDGGSSSGIPPTAGCKPGETRCDGPRIESCGPDGTFTFVTSCLTPRLCELRSGAECAPTSCIPGETRCQEDRFVRCSADGKELVEVARCLSKLHCSPGTGCVKCFAGEAHCDYSCEHVGGPSMDDCLETCNATKTGFDSKNCGIAQSSGISESCSEYPTAHCRP